MPSSSVCAWAWETPGLRRARAAKPRLPRSAKSCGGAGHHERNPGFRLVGDAAEPGRHDADDRSMRGHRAAAVRPSNRGVGAEAPLPQAVAQNDDGVALRHFILFRAEGAAEGGAHSQQVEVGLRDDSPRDALGLIDAGEGHGAGIERRHGCRRSGSGRANRRNRDRKRRGARPWRASRCPRVPPGARVRDRAAGAE